MLPLAELAAAPRHRRAMRAVVATCWAKRLLVIVGVAVWIGCEAGDAETTALVTLAALMLIATTACGLAAAVAVTTAGHSRGVGIAAGLLSTLDLFGAALPLVLGMAVHPRRRVRPAA